jgi:hypothetical protein
MLLVFLLRRDAALHMFGRKHTFRLPRDDGRGALIADYDDL